MPELRKDPVIKRWVIIATERAKRPSDFGTAKTTEKKGGFCPFDYGNEHLTPPEVLAFRSPNSKPNEPGWWIRVVPNKFPALDPKIKLRRKGMGMYDVISGTGAHEIIIETPDHNLSMADMKRKQVQEIIWAYKDRYDVLSKRDGIRYVLIFKNYKREAGASLEHSHSQIIATPIVPKRVEEELEGAKEYYEYKERCVFCDIINQELSDGKRIVEENDSFLAIAPFAARFPFETWILPKEHKNNFVKISDNGVSQFAEVLSSVLKRLKKALNDPPFNYIIHSSPVNDRGKEFYHWHLELIPRLTKVAGFEWGSGFYINPTPPEDAAKFLREVEI
ncbi:MAG: galactose-1-phosphate uridylyltransferase [Thermotoga sp.]|nr:MAG: galactose-1-phosphate uridylyltransferase [Thermotoga sp.]